MAYLNEHELYCDPANPTPECYECKMEVEQARIKAEQEAEAEASDRCGVCGVGERLILNVDPNGPALCGKCANEQETI